MVHEYSIINKVKFPEVHESVQTHSPSSSEMMLISVYNEIKITLPATVFVVVRMLLNFLPPAIT